MREKIQNLRDEVARLKNRKEKPAIKANHPEEEDDDEEKKPKPRKKHRSPGLFIWQQCGVARTLDEIVAEVQKGFEEVPSEQVAQDVKEFVDGMVSSGFIDMIKKTGV